MVKNIVLTFLIFIPTVSAGQYHDNPIIGKIEQFSSDRHTVGNKELGLGIIINNSTCSCNFFGAFPGSITKLDKICSYHERNLWVDNQYNVSTNYQSKPTIRVCASDCITDIISEKCVEMNSEQEMSDVTVIGNIKVASYSFTKTSTGANENADKTDDQQGHRVGYVYNLFSAECPYITDSSIDREQCLLKYNKDIPITKEYYKGVKYSAKNNCYEVARQSARCPSHINECVCIDSDDNGNCNASNGYIPNKTSVYWRSLSKKQQDCFNCYADSRKRLNTCIIASYDKGWGYGPGSSHSKLVNSVMNTLKTKDVSSQEFKDAYNKFQILRNMYGTGKYLCAFNSFDQSISSRIGCLKIRGNLAGPRPFPRIAFPLDSNNIPIGDKLEFFAFPASHLFEKKARVKQFNDTTEFKTCDGIQEIGDFYRGDFYNPSIIIQYGYNKQKIWFNPTNDANFVTKYRSTSPKFNNADSRTEDIQRSMRSDWAEKKPIVVNYGIPSPTSSNLCQYTVSQTYAKICARIEYSDEREAGYFVAYNVKTKHLFNDNDCNTFENDGALELLGGVPRPPLKYTYDNALQRTITPIVMSNPIATQKAAQAIIHLDPTINKQYVDSSKIMPDSSLLSPTYYSSFITASGEPSDAARSIITTKLPLTFINAQVLKSNATQVSDYIKSLTGNANCGYILNHKICIGPFMGIDCQLLNSDNETGIREGIRMGTIDTDSNCPDTACKNELKMFNQIRQKCLTVKRCQVGQSNTDCAQTPPLRMSLSAGSGDHIYNYDWNDGVCITQGVQKATFGETGSTTLYGTYQGVTQANDSVMSFKVGTQGPKIAIRKSGNMGETGPDNLVEISENTFKYSEDNQILEMMNSIKMANQNLIEKYFGSTCTTSTCIKDKITIRPKNNDEMGLCVKFNRIDSIQYGFGLNNTSYAPNKTNTLYVPYKCDYLEAYVLGPGGKSEQWNSDARIWFKTAYIGPCAGQAIAVAVCCTIGQLYGCNCTDSSNAFNDICSRSLQSGGGGGGGYVHGIIDINAADTDTLMIFPGSDENTPNAPFSYSAALSSPYDPVEIAPQNQRMLMANGINIDTNNITTDLLVISKSDSMIYWKNQKEQNYIMLARTGEHKIWGEDGATGGSAQYDISYLARNGYLSGTQQCPLDLIPPKAPVDQSKSMGSGPTKPDTTILDSFSSKFVTGENKCAQSYDKVCYELYTATSPRDGSCSIAPPSVPQPPPPQINKITPTGYCDCSAEAGSCCTDRNCNDNVIDVYNKLCVQNAYRDYCNAMESDSEKRRQCLATCGWIHTEERCASISSPCSDGQNAHWCNWYERSKDNCMFNLNAEYICTGSSGGSQDTCMSNLNAEYTCTGSFGNSKVDVSSMNYKYTCKYKMTQQMRDNLGCLPPQPSEPQKYTYCCANTTCLNQKNALDNYTAQTNSSVQDYSSKQINYKNDLATYKAANSQYLDENEKKVANSLYNMCPFTMKGEDGEFALPYDDTITLNGGGNRVIKVLNGIANGCPEPYSDDCTLYRMTKNYCALPCSGPSCSLLEFEAGSTMFIKKHPFKGSGGCARDHNPSGGGGLAAIGGDNNGGDDKEAWGGDGWIKIGVPFVKYSSGFTPDTRSGRKILDKTTGMRDIDCVPRCPRAFIEVENMVCEYSSGDPKNGYETAQGSMVQPIKCISSQQNDKGSQIVIPSSSMERVCLFTKCSNYRRNYRHYGFCADNDIYSGDVFINGAAYYINLVKQESDKVKYCNGTSKDVSVTINDKLNTSDFTMICDDHGHWKSMKSNTRAKYACPEINGYSFGRLNPLIFPIMAKVPEMTATPGNGYCGAFGIFKKMS